MKNLRALTPLFTIAAASLAAAACGIPDGVDTGADTDDETKAGEINGGTLVSPNRNTQDPFRATVAFTQHPDDFADCTATKIFQGPTVDTYLTAAHCLPGAVANTPIRYTNALTFPGNFISTRARSVFQHPSCLVDPDAGNLCLNASRFSYDIALFTVDTNPNIPVLVASPPIQATATAAGQRSRMIGYGCDNLSNQDDQKQSVLVTTADQGNAVAADFARYIRTVGDPSGCSGDSGGPFLNSTGTLAITGVTSFALTTRLPSGGTEISTHFARAANVRRWIQNPGKLNAISDRELGFLLNRAGRRCAQATTPGSGANSGECSGVNQPTDPQYWRLLQVPGTTFFQIQNTNTSECLSAVLLGLTSMQTCNAATQSQHWRLSIPVRAPFLRIQNRVNSTSSATQCLKPTNGTTILVLSTCSNTDQGQDWLFFP